MIKMKVGCPDVIVNIILAYVPVPVLSTDVSVDVLLKNSDKFDMDAAHPERALQTTVADKVSAVADICTVI